MGDKHHSGIDAAPRGAAWKYEFFGMTAIYAIGPRDGRPLKIGLASDIYARFSSIQGCNWQQLWVHYLVWTQGPLIALRVEKECHQILGKNKIRGEWFDITPQLACDTIHIAGDRLKVGLKSHKNMLVRIDREEEREMTSAADLPLSPLFLSRKIPGGA